MKKILFTMMTLLLASIGWVKAEEVTGYGSHLKTTLTDTPNRGIDINNLYVSRTGWAMWEEVEDVVGQWYYYDDGEYYTCLGYGNHDSWAVMFPAGTYSGTVVTKVAIFDCDQMPEGTVSIYNDGDEAPANLVGQTEIAFTYRNEFVEFEFETPVTINPDKNLWVVASNTGLSMNYIPCALSHGYSDNGIWLYDSYTESWVNCYEEWGMEGAYMIRAFVGDPVRGTEEMLSHETLSLNEGIASFSGERYLEYYSVVCTSISGEPIFNANTKHPFCQIDTDYLVEGETYICKVAAVFNNGTSDYAEVEWQYESCDNYAGSVNDVAVSHNTIYWTYLGDDPTPIPTGDWYYYGNDIWMSAIGANGPFYWAIMFPAGSYEGNMVTKVACFGAHNDMWGLNGAFDGSVSIYNDGTTEPRNLVGEMEISMPDVSGFVEYEFETPVVIDPTKNLWIVFHNRTSSGNVASACWDLVEELNGRWVSTDGIEWEDIHHLVEADVNWMIRAYIDTDAKGEVKVLSYEPENFNSYTKDSVKKPIYLPRTHNSGNSKYTMGNPISHRADDNVLGAMIFIDGEYEAFVPVPTNSYTYEGDGNEVCVRIVYDGGDELPANNYYYAMSCGEYTSFDAVGEIDGGNVSMYPNPTSGNVKIEAEGMTRITVVNVLGQVVYDHEVAKDLVSLNMGQFNSGMYMVQVYTESGMTVKRIIVMQ